MIADAVVIGGSGFIGRHLVRTLVARGQRVRVASRSGGSGRQPLERVTFVRAAVGDAEAIRAAVKDAATVYCLSTGGGNQWSDFERDFLAGARNVASACRESGSRLVYASSIAALYLGGSAAITDATPPDRRASERSFYARAKAEAESILRRERDSGLSLVIIRPGVVMGSGGSLQHSGLGYWASDLCCIGWGMGNHPLPFVLAGDVAEAMAAAGEREGAAGQTFNLAGDVRLTAREFIAALRTRARRDFRFYPRPLLYLQSIELAKWVLKAAARKPENPLPSYRDLASRSLRAPFDCARAKSELGWRCEADRERFLQAAIDPHLRPIRPGDLRAAREG